MRLRIFHRTEYLYSHPVSESANELRLRPKSSRNQECESCFISVLPAAHLLSYQDLYQNNVHHFEIGQAHARLVVESRARVSTNPRIDFNNLPYGVPMARLTELQGMEACHAFLHSSHYVELDPEIWRRAVDIQGESSDVFQTAYAIMEYIFNVYDYKEGSTLVSTQAQEVIRKQMGVCQDFAHAMVGFCRSLHMPARYVSGYVFDATHDHSLRGSQATHAWVEVFIPDTGWVGFDPTNRKVVDETYVTIATGRDYQDVAPIAGTFFGDTATQLLVDVKVRRLNSAI